LRGLAILLVFSYHAWLFSWLTPSLSVFGIALPVDTFPRVGYLGVDLFFLVSGFCLFFPDARSAVDGAPELSLREFAYRRFIKIVPSYALALAATVIVSLPLFGSARELAWPVANHLLFVNNWFYDALGKNNSVFWSLAVEAQFYLIFPLAAFAFQRMPLVTALAMIGIAQLYRWGTVRCCLENELVMRQLPAFLDLFAWGMLAAYALVWARRRLPELARYRTWFTLAALALAAGGFALLQACNGVQYAPQGRALWDVQYRTLLGCVVAAVALASCLAQGWWGRLVANPLLVFLSLISYNLYLWHTLVLLWMLHHNVPPAATPVAHDDEHWRPLYLALGTAASLTLATAVTYFIERPLLGSVKPQSFCFRWPRLSGRPARSTAPPGTRT
jgi:peptidoglycan/LPS O-acetylase OafA/YrhL